MIKDKRIEEIESSLLDFNKETEVVKKLEDYTIDNEHYQSLNYLRDVFYNTSKEKGWHANDEVLNIGNFISNIHSEASEFWEAFRNKKLNEPCDKSEKMIECSGVSLTCAEEELADICIRLLDLCATLNIDIAKAVYVKNSYNKTRSFRHGGKLA